MDHFQSRTVTQLLLDWRNGDPAAFDELITMVYGEIHKRARARINRENPGHMLQATALINEVYLRLVDQSQVDWKSRDHFFAACARLMQEILLDIKRAEKAIKRGGDFRFVALDEAQLVSQDQREELSALDDALKILADLSPRQRWVVELRYFGGLSIEDTAETLSISPETVKRDWRLARAWLLRELDRGRKP